jgi:RHS repeat-associated protein
MKRLALRLLLVAIAIAATPFLTSAAAQQTPQWDSGVYVYDGSGNIVRVGLDQYRYDTANRLSYATADQQRAQSGLRQEYGYDSFGNRITVRNCVTQTCTAGSVPAAPLTNHLNDGTSYNEIGAVVGGPTGSPAHSYTYDPVGMLSSQAAGGKTVQYVYTADDQRIAVDSSGDWQWSVRDVAQRVVRDVTHKDGSSEWTAVEDYVQGGTGFTGSVSSIGRRHVHFDHLGTPRVVTDDSGRLVGQHAYYAFGEALQIGSESPAERLHFTGHERDTALGGETLDYMHARYYGSAQGRFLSVDPLLQTELAVRSPQMWNRYAYVRNNPARLTDPTGEYDVNCTGVSARDHQRCTAASARFETQRLRNLRSRDATVRAAAQRWGTPGDGNGITVAFRSQAQVNSDAGRTGGGTNTDGFVDPNHSQNGVVDIRAEFVFSMSNGQLSQTIAHEGSHLGDDLAFIKSFDPATGKYSAALNLTHYESEFSAYETGAAVRPYPAFQPGPRGYRDLDRFIRANYPNANDLLFSPTQFRQ